LYTAQNLKSIKVAPYNDRPQDYACKVKFQLSRYKSSSGILEPYLADWKEVVDILRKDSDFYNKFFSKSSTDKLWNQVASELNNKATDFEKAAYIYEYVKDNITWDENFRLYPMQSGDKSFELKKGNSAAINAAAINLMRLSGLKAYPLVSNPVSEGGINKYYPDMENFGHTFGIVQIDNKNIFFDAAYTDMPFGIIGEEDLVPEALMITENSFEWVEIPIQERKSVYSINIALNEEKNIQGKMSMKLNTLAYADESAHYENDKEGKHWIERMKKDEGEFKMKDYKMISNDNLKKECRVGFDFNYENIVIESEDKLYVPINLLTFFSENPFKDPERDSPINFKNITSENYILAFAIPEGYEIESLPKNINMATTKREISFMISFTNTGPSITVNRKIGINEYFIFEDVYKEVKTIYEEIINRSNEMIVLKKKV
jgi:Transglutaminase-like superfamily